MKNMYRLSVWILLLSLLIISACKSTKEAASSSEDGKKEVTKVAKEPSKTPLLPAKTDDQKSLLWEISGNDLKTPSYLFGTIHLIAKKDFFMSDLVKNRFAQTSQLALEIDMNDPTIMVKMMSGMMMEDGKTLKDVLGEEDYALLGKYFKDSLGMGLMLFDRMKPILLSTMMMEKGMEEVVSYENVFLEMAKENQMEIKGLETAEFQMSMLDSIPYEVQGKMLMEGIKQEGGETKICLLRWWKYTSNRTLRSFTTLL